MKIILPNPSTNNIPQNPVSFTEEIHLRGYKQGLAYIRLEQPKILQTINTPRNERAVITVCPDEKSRKELDITEKRMKAYADRHSLDFIVISEISSQKHPCGNKYAYSEVANLYQQSLWLDTDVVVSYNAPNIFDIVPEGSWGLYNEGEDLKEKEWYQKEWFESQKAWKVPIKPLTSAWNSGIVVAPQNAAEHYYPPKYPVPDVWCAEQLWHTYCLLDQSVVNLSYQWNNGFNWPNFERQVKSSYFNHINGCAGSLRLKILEYLDAEQEIPYDVWNRPKIECPKLDTDNNCLIIYQLAGEPYYPSRKECEGCSKCPIPQSVNEITSGISNKILMEAGLPSLHKIGHGPGTRLKSAISWFYTEDPGCDCGNRAKIMDAWHIDGCKRNFNTIVHWLYESAHLKNIPITRGTIEVIVRGLLALPYKKD